MRVSESALIGCYARARVHRQPHVPPPAVIRLGTRTQAPRMTKHGRYWHGTSGDTRGTQHSHEAEHAAPGRLQRPNRRRPTTAATRTQDAGDTWKSLTKRKNVDARAPVLLWKTYVVRSTATRPRTQGCSSHNALHVRGRFRQGSKRLLPHGSAQQRITVRRLGCWHQHTLLTHQECMQATPTTPRQCQETGSRKPQSARGRAHCLLSAACRELVLDPAARGRTQ
jgi:hypothetical protein